MATHASDSTLLERFVSDREEAAFVALVKRHGPRVQGTCRRVLRNEHDVEEVFQATFLLLARKAAVVAWRDSVGSWLCAVAHRLAMGARADASRHRRREVAYGSLTTKGNADCVSEQYDPLADPLNEVEHRELRRLIDDELLRLPEKYRAPVILCDLEGRTHQEAAAQLGWPSGSISRRLVQARALLRRRLAHRGVTLGIGLAGIGLAAFLASQATNRDDRPATTVHELMTSLRPLSAGIPGLTTNHAPYTLDSPTPDLAQILNLALQAARAAKEIETQGPGRNRADWRSSAVAMHDSAQQLAQAVQEHDRLAMISAARRLDASCRECHEVFRE